MEDFVKKYPRFLYIFLWIIVIFIHSFILNSISDLSLAQSFVDSIVFNVLYAIIGTGLWFMVRYSNLQSKSVFEIFINHLAGSVFTISAWLSFGYLILKGIYSNDSFYMGYLEQTIVFRGISGALIYIVIVSIYYLILNFRELKEKMEHEAELNNMLRDAELGMLRSQIRPHFLFNSLNSISSLTMSNPEKAQDMVIKLSEFMRYSLNYKDEKLITLDQELYHIQLYLDIEKVRFGNKLKFRFIIPDKCKSLKLPSLILQPLAENSVKYGLYESTEDVTIKLVADCEDGYLKIIVGNDFDPDSSPKKGTGTGLKNIEKRLQTIYSGLDLLKVNKTENYFEVTIKIPQYV